MGFDGSSKRISTEILLNNIKGNINYIPYDKNIEYVEELKKSRTSFSYIYVGETIDTYDLMFVITHELRTEIENGLNNENF